MSGDPCEAAQRAWGAQVNDAPHLRQLCNCHCQSMVEQVWLPEDLIFPRLPQISSLMFSNGEMPAQCSR